MTTSWFTSNKVSAASTATQGTGAPSGRGWLPYGSTTTSGSSLDGDVPTPSSSLGPASGFGGVSGAASWFRDDEDDEYAIGAAAAAATIGVTGGFGNTAAALADNRSITTTTTSTSLVSTSQTLPPQQHHGYQSQPQLQQQQQQQQQPPPPYTDVKVASESTPLLDDLASSGKNTLFQGILLKLAYALVAITLVVGPFFIYFYVPRAPGLTYQTSYLIKLNLTGQAIILRDEWLVDNQNYQDLTLTKFTYDIYYEGILFGSGSNEYNTVFSPRSQGSFNATKLICSTNSSVFASIVDDCRATGTFSLKTESQSFWKIMLSSQYLSSVNTASYFCDSWQIPGVPE